MPIEKTIIVGVLLYASGISGYITFYAWFKHRFRGITVFVTLMLACTLYSAGYAGELLSTSLSGMLFWLRIEYLGIALSPPMWVIITMYSIGKEKLLKKPILAGLMLIPVFTLIFNYTDNYFHLYYASVSVNNRGIFPVLSLTKGVWAWVQVIFTNLCIAFPLAMVIRMWLKAPLIYKTQAMLIIMASLPAWVGIIIYQMGLSPAGIDLAPIAMTISWPYLYILFKRRYMDVMPIARDALFENIMDGVLVLDMQDHLLDFNPKAQTMVPVLNHKKLSESIYEVFSEYPELVRQVRDSILEPIQIQAEQKEKGSFYESKLSFVTKKKNSGKHSEAICKILVLHDVTQHIVIKENLFNLAIHDDLTSIFNRRHFIELANIELERSKRYGRPLSLLFLDLDHFKVVNDNFGHLAGDLVLKSVVSTCQEVIRNIDVFGRFGGEEFSILLPETDLDEAQSIGIRICNAVSESPVKFEKALIRITTSIGIASVEKIDNQTIDELFKLADSALYIAKNNGRNCVKIMKMTMIQ